MAEHRLQRLYLEKDFTDENDIYIDTKCLPQHQYDGIRFLYRQYKRDKAGVILNDPPGYGKRVQTMLFLQAMRPTLNLPILILCTDGLEEVWADLLNQWTNMGPDVYIQKANEYTKSMCVIRSVYQSNLLSRREWSILVMDDNNVSRDALRAGVSAMFKIWLTSVDMKKHLQTFSLIYKCLYPKDKFLVEDYQTFKKPTAILSNSVKLDAFMEDIVIRRRDVALPLGIVSTPDHQVTRKNKDATGRKIKRSKRLPDYSQDTSSESQSTPEQDIQKTRYKDEGTEKFVVNIDNKGEDKMDEDDIENKLIEVTLDSNNIVTKHSRKKPGAYNIQNDKDFNSGNNEVPKRYSTPKSDTKHSFTALNSDKTDSQNIILKYENETQEKYLESLENFIPAKKSKMMNEINISEDLFSTDIVPSDRKSDKVNNRKANAKTSDNQFSTYLPTNEASDVIKPDDVDSKKNELINNVSENEKTDPQLSGIELKM